MDNLEKYDRESIQSFFPDYPYASETILSLWYLLPVEKRDEIIHFVVDNLPIIGVEGTIKGCCKMAEEIFYFGCDFCFASVVIGIDEYNK